MPARSKNDIKKDWSKNLLLLTILPILSIGITYLITEGGVAAGVLFIFGLLGIAASVVTLLYPIFGFYLTITFAFFISDIVRLFQMDFPVGVLIDMLCVLTFLGVIMNKYSKNEKLLANCNHPVVIGSFIVIVYSLIQLFNPNGGPIGDTIILLRRFIALQLMFYSAIQLFNSKKDIYTFLKIWITLSLITALYGCYQEWAGYPAYEMRHILSNPIAEGLLSLDNGNYRKFSFLPDPTSFGIMMSGTALICVMFLMNNRIDAFKRTLLFFAIIFMVLAMSYSGTRTAYFAFTVGIALYIMMTISNRKTLIFSAIAFSSFLFLLFAPIYNNATLNRVRSTFEFSEDASMNVRDVNRHKIQPYIYSHPIGGGLGTTGGAPTDLELSKSSSHPLAGFQTDSGFLRMALEYGWIGLIIQCTVFFLILQQGVHAYYRRSSSEDRVILLGALICLFSYIIAHYAQGAIGTLPGAYLFYSLVAIIIRFKPGTTL